MPLIALIVVLIVEALGFSLWLDTGSTASSSGLTHLLSLYGAVAVGSGVVFAFLAPVVFYRRIRELEFLKTAAFRRDFAILHAISVACFALCSTYVFGKDAGPVTAATWLIAGTALVGSAMLACYPWKSWLVLAREFGAGLAVVLVISIGTALLSRAFWQMWDVMGQITFVMVSLLLRPLVAGIQFDAVAKTITSANFAVEIAPQCSGYEGMGLVLVFGAVWLWLNRRDYQFPQALVLLPGGVALIFLLNSVRIAALFLIGHAGAAAVAAGGFHSQAGWIAFLLVSLGMAAGSRHIPLLARSSGTSTAPVSAAPADPTTVAVAPFVAAMAAALLTSAVSSGFDWLYPLRTIAAVAVLWLYREEYRKLNWTVNLESVLSGVLVIAIWIGMAHTGGTAVAAPPLWWIAVRAISATLVVPVIEELAFRHFLQRRITSENFEMIDPTRSTWFGVAVSSLLFGLMHGQQWIAGTIAGAIFGIQYRRQGSVGAATMSHAVANALLAAYVITTGTWQLW